MSSRFESNDMHRALVESVRAWSHSVLAQGASERDAQARFDPCIYRRMDTDLGLMGIALPDSLGGLGLGIGVTILAIEAMSEVDPGMAMSYLAQEVLFSYQLYETWASEGAEMPQRHADTLRRRPVTGLAMTEPDAGTDILAMRTTAVPCEGGFVLNGTKQWITNAPVGEAFLVYARTGEGRRDISLFLVEYPCAGLERGEAEPKMGMRSSPTGMLCFRDCFVPEDALAGRLHGGFSSMLRNLAIERVALAAQSCGIAKACLDIMCDYASSRRAFGRPIAEFGQIQRYLGEGFAKWRAGRRFLYATLEDILDGHCRASLDADAVKLFCTTAAEEISRCAIQVLGANGYSCGYAVERLHRDAILLSIGGGTNEALQKNISRLLTHRRAQ